MSPPLRIAVLEPLPDRIGELYTALPAGEHGIEARTGCPAPAAAERLDEVPDER